MVGEKSAIVFVRNEDRWLVAIGAAATVGAKITGSVAERERTEHRVGFEKGFELFEEFFHVKSPRLMPPAFSR